MVSGFSGLSGLKTSKIIIFTTLLLYYNKKKCKKNGLK